MHLMTIDLIPDLITKCPHICNAHKNKKLIIFVGAGISALWGCKRWKDMATSLINSCYEKGKINYWTQESLLHRHSASPRKLITIANNILAEDEYLAALQGTIKIDDNKKKSCPELYKNLFEMNAIYFTTNIDTHFSELFGEHTIYEPDNFTPSICKPKRIIHLHGKIDKSDSLVLTIDEYMRRYQHDNFGDFLKNVFSDEEYCFLFIGYGVDEFEIIDFMTEKYRRTNPQAFYLDNFYILLPFFSNQEELLKYEESYFKKIHITIIPYSIDNIGHNQLNEVIATWRQTLLEVELKDKFSDFNKIMWKEDL